MNIFATFRISLLALRSPGLARVAGYWRSGYKARHCLSEPRSEVHCSLHMSLVRWV